MRVAAFWILLTSLWVAPWLAASAAEDPVVAVVGGREIPLSYVRKQIQSVPLAEQIDLRGDLARFVDSVVHEEVLFQHGLRRAREDAAWREKLKTAVVTALLEEQVRDKAGVAEQDVATFYREEIVAGDHEHIRVRHVAFNNAGQCDWAVKEVKGEGDLAALAQVHHSNPVFAQRGGDLGYLMRRSRVLGFEQEMFDLAEGRLHRIDKADACHLIWIAERVTQAPPPFDEIKDRLRRQLERRQEAALLQAVLDRARQTVEVERRPLP